MGQNYIGMFSWCEDPVKPNSQIDLALLFVYDAQRRKKARMQFTDLGLRYPHTESMCIVVYVDKQMSISALRKHACSNIQKISASKKLKFSDKISDVFPISAQNIDCGYSSEPPRRGGYNEYPQSMFLGKNKKNDVYPFKPQFYRSDAARMLRLNLTLAVRMWHKDLFSTLRTIYDIRVKDCLDVSVDVLAKLLVRIWGWILVYPKADFCQTKYMPYSS